MRNYVVFDLETTGKDYSKDRIIEITGIKLNHLFQETERFHALISCPFKLPKVITELTNITDKMLEEEGREYEVVMQEFSLFIQNCILVAHNAEFDLMFLYYVLSMMNIQYQEHDFYDTLFMARQFITWSKRHNLGELCKELSIELHQHHRSTQDVEATIELFKLLFAMMKGRKVECRNRIFYLKEIPEFCPPKSLYEPYIPERIQRIFFA